MKLKIFVKIFTKANNFLTSADIQKNQAIMIRRITWKICGGPKNSFVGLKAKMYTFTTEMEHNPQMILKKENYECYQSKRY